MVPSLDRAGAFNSFCPGPLFHIGESMKAAILVELNAQLVVDEVQIPALTEGQVLVKIEAAGICGKQLGEIAGHYGPDKFIPHLLGHEGAGIVKAVGPGVSFVKPGDHVVAHWRKGKGLEGECPKYQWGEKVVGGGRITTFSEYAVISENRLTAIAHDIPFDIAALFGCSTTTGLGVVFNDAKLQPGQSIAVIGCGGVGLNVIQGARIAGASRIIAVDIIDEKLNLAEGMAGSTWEKYGDRGEDHERLRGVDVIVDTTGRPELIARAYELVAPGGKVIMVGQPKRGEALILRDVAGNFKGKTLMDSQGGGTNPATDIPKYLDMWRDGDLKLSELITHRFPLEQINEALDVVRSGEAGRVIIEP